ncbi:hypothetical protein LCGC14_3142160 [marine sediment metagenome]|uniref:Uncharacterized protein n=1 Tax=marine sediment metagenome TaxID=412755 RepID=A0A0F8YKV7_9ZZZZ
MSRINEYKCKKKGFDNLDNVIPYQSGGVRHSGNMPEYTILLRTNMRDPECSWLYEAIVKHWSAIRETMKEVGSKDVNKSKMEADKEANEFLGLV